MKAFVFCARICIGNDSRKYHCLAQITLASFSPSVKQDYECVETLLQKHGRPPQHVRRSSNTGCHLLLQIEWYHHMTWPMAKYFRLIIDDYFSVRGQHCATLLLILDRHFQTLEFEITSFFTLILWFLIIACFMCFTVFSTKGLFFCFFLQFPHFKCCRSVN